LKKEKKEKKKFTYHHFKRQKFWDETRNLFGVAFNLEPSLPIEKKEREAVWTLRARKWGNALVRLYNPSAVTPYIHLFVYHFGTYLGLYDSVEMFANYAIESKHKTIKQRLYGGTRKPFEGVQSKSAAGRALSIRILRKDLLDFRLQEKAPFQVRVFEPRLELLSSHLCSYRNRKQLVVIPTRTDRQRKEERDGQQQLLDLRKMTRVGKNGWKWQIYLPLHNPIPSNITIVTTDYSFAATLLVFSSSVLNLQY
jgi:hypothetical protein